MKINIFKIKRTSEAIPIDKKELQSLQAATSEITKVSYHDMIYEEYNAVIQSLEYKIKDLEQKWKDSVKRIQQDPSSINTKLLVEVKETFYKQLKAAELELEKKKFEYGPDFGLIALADELDRLHVRNEGAVLTWKLYRQLKNMATTINKACECYGGDYYTPLALVQIRDSIQALLTALNNNMKEVTIKDKNQMLGKFNQCFDVYREKQKEKKMIERELAEAGIK